MELRYSVIAAFVQNSGSIGDALTALKVSSDIWVKLKSLEFLIWIEIGILVI